jgi:hypothetical protein
MAGEPSKRPAEPARDPALAALPFVLKKLDEIYAGMKGGRSAHNVVEAKRAVEDGNYIKASDLLKATRDADAAPARGSLGAALGANKGPSREMIAALTTVIGLMEPVRKWQEQQAAAAPPKPSASNSTAEGGKPPLSLDDLPPAPVLDLTVFSQLQMAVQQTGLFNSTDAIVAVREREFPAGRYQRAFDMIEELCTQLNTASARRQAELRTEERQYKSGTLKMSPREWLARQRRVTEQNQKIERARRYFARVLDGLRLLRVNNP